MGVWDDSTPQKHRHDLTVDDLLPSEEAFFDRAVMYTTVADLGGVRRVQMHPPLQAASNVVLRTQLHESIK